MATEMPNPDRERMRQLFSVPIEKHGDTWSALWAEGTFLPWDRGTPNPALVDLLPTLDLQPGQSALIPGCGRGYDVHLFATHGLQATGLEIAPDAVKMAKEWIAEEKKKNGGLPDKASSEIVEGDFYKRDWEREGGYDYVMDYTFLCAMPLERRNDWGRRMSEIIKPGGHLICIEFPLYKAPETGGPPFGVTEQLYIELLGENFERVKRFKPERTHEIGKNHDHISIWKRK